MRMLMSVESFVLLVITVFSISVFWNGMYLNTGGGITGHAVNEPSNLITGNVVKVANSEPQVQQGGGGAAQAGGGSVTSGFSEGVTRNIIVGGTVISTMDDNGVTYNHKDRLGSNRVQTDSQGLKVSEFKSLPYGQTVKKSEMRHEFTEKEKDESGDYYFGARYYDPDLGKFSSVDPVTDNHAFGYVNNNPMKYIDPTGMEKEEPCECPITISLADKPGFFSHLNFGVGGFSGGSVSIDDTNIAKYARGRSYNPGVSGYSASVGGEFGSFSFKGEGFINTFDSFNEYIGFDNVPLGDFSVDAQNVAVDSAASGKGGSLSLGYTHPTGFDVNLNPENLLGRALTAPLRKIFGDEVSVAAGTTFGISGSYNSISTITNVNGQFQRFDENGVLIPNDQGELSTAIGPSTNAQWGGTLAATLSQPLGGNGAFSGRLRFPIATYGSPDLSKINPNIAGLTFSQNIGKFTVSGTANIQNLGDGNYPSKFSEVGLNGWQAGLSFSP